jgi:hypothetical protein
MKRLLKCFIGIAIVIFLVTAYSSRPIGVEVASAASKYIEVCRNGTVYVPPGTKFVTCQGRVMRVIAIVSLGAEPKGAPVDCNCPKCCDGGCVVTIACEGGGLCVLYLAC